MHNWRLLLLAFLAAIQPIASFSERNNVDGLQECCNRQPLTLVRDSRLLYGTQRFSNNADEYRLNHPDELREERRYEVKKLELSRIPSHNIDTWERNNRRISRHSRTEKRFGRNTENNNRFFSVDTGERIARDTTIDIRSRISRELVTREDSRNKLESQRLFQDERRITRLKNDRCPSDFHRDTKHTQGYSRELRRVSYTREIIDGTRSENNINEGMPTERQNERRRSLIRTTLRSEMDNNEERRSLDRQISEHYDVTRRSLSLETGIRRVNNIRADARATLRSEMDNNKEGRSLDRQVSEHKYVTRRSLSLETGIRRVNNIRANARAKTQDLEYREKVDSRTNEGFDHSQQQRGVIREQRDRTMSVRLSYFERKQDREDFRTSDRRFIEQSPVRESSDSSQLVDIRGTLLTRVRASERFERNVYRRVGRERVTENRREIRASEVRSIIKGLEEKESFANARLEKRSERFTDSQRNIRFERRSSVEARRSEQLSKNRQEIIMPERRRSQHNIARVVRNQQNIRSNRSPFTRQENERVSEIRQEIKTVESRIRITGQENAERFANIRENRHDEGLSRAVARHQTTQIYNHQEIKSEETLSRRENARAVHRNDARISENRRLITRDENIRSRNRLTGNERRITPSRERNDRLESRVNERNPSATRGDNERLSQHRYEIRDLGRPPVGIQGDLSRNRQVRRFSKETIRMDSERMSREVSKSIEESRDVMNNKRYSRLSEGREALRTKERSTNRYDSRENVWNRSVETVDRDVSRIRNVMRREVDVSRLRNSESTELRNRDAYDAESVRSMHFEKPIGWNWQMVLYTLQAIYLCSFLTHVVTDITTKNKLKSRSLIWLTGTSEHLKLN